jgi:hypothetical protein
MTLYTAQPYEAGLQACWHANRSISTGQDPGVDDPKYTKTTGGMDREDRTGIPVCSTFPSHFIRDRDHRPALLIVDSGRGINRPCP